MGEHGVAYLVRPKELAIAGGAVITHYGFGATVVDSGTTYTYFPTAIFKDLRDGVIEYCTRHDMCGASLMGDGCWRPRGGGPDETSRKALANFPPLKFRFEDGVLHFWQPHAYLYKKGSENTWCFGFADNGDVAQTVLGTTWMLHMNIVFDITNSRLGLAVAECPEFRVRPPQPNGVSAAVSKLNVDHLDQRARDSPESSADDSWLPAMPKVPEIETPDMPR